MTAAKTADRLESAARAGGEERRRAVVIRPARAVWGSLHQQLAQLTEYRDLFYTLTAHRVSVRYRQTALGVIWAVLHPLVMMLIFTAVFSVLARMPSDGVPYALFAYVALLPWTFFATAFTNATSSLVTHGQLITKVYFPREILPATYVAAALFDFAIGFVVLLGLMQWYGVALTIQALHLLPIIMLLVAWILAVSLVLSTVQVRWRDVGVGMPLLLQFWMFASPVIYPLSIVPAEWRPVYLLNPMAGIISSFRDVLLHGVQPDPVPLRYAAIVTACALPVAYAVFKRNEAAMADLI